MAQQLNTRYIWYDFETTGFNPYSCQIIEIGAIDNYGNKLEVLLKSNKALSERITEVTGITNELLRENGVEQAEGLSKLRDFINLYNDNFKNNTYLIAHNNDAFDHLFLKFQFQKYNVE